MTKFYLFLSRSMVASLMLITSVAFAQRTVTGKVTSSDDGSPIPGVNIQIKGTTTGTVTNSSGDYSLNVTDNTILVFSFVGYATQEISVGSQTTVNVSMQLDVTALSEVVVIGYGQTTIKDATGSVAAVTSEDFNKGVIASPEQLIQGKTAGVQITSVSGSPGDGVQLRIRGTTSIRSNNNPLFVVDGVPLSGGTQPASADVGFGTTGDTNPLNFINPNDIESISILKDASATAIYGSRGANGVVIITTKGGKGKNGIFEFASSISISSQRKKYDLLSPSVFLQAVEDYSGVPAQDGGASTDWQDFITRTSMSNKQNLSYSKSFAKSSIRASMGYEDQQGILKNSYMKRFTSRFNGTKSFGDALKVDFSATYSNVKREDPPISGNSGFQGDILGAAYSANPTWPTDPDFNPGGQRSPANMLEYYRSEGITNRLLSNLSTEYKITNGLVAKATYGLDWAKGERVTLATANSINAGNGVQGFGQGQLNENSNINHLFELTLNHTKTYGNVKVEIVGGYSIQSFRNKWFWASARGFDSETFEGMESELRRSYRAGMAAASAALDTANNWGNYDIINTWGISNTLTRTNGPSINGGFVGGIAAGSLSNTFFKRPSDVIVDAIAANFYDQTDYIQSYFTRGNFTILDKFLITATIRVDGSSRFGDDNKYGIFPSGAVAWKLHEEDFLPELISTLKLRGGYGIVGNQDGLGYGNFKRRDRYADASITESRQIAVPGTTRQGSTNPGLKWESTKQLSIGVDFGVLNDKLSGSLDYYNKKTSDLLLRYQVAQPSLETQIFDNLNDAIVENKGWELSLTYNVLTTTDASLSVSGNVSHNKNLLTGFNGQIEAGQIYGQGLSGAYAQILAGGHPLFSYYLREFEGFDSNGQPIGDNQTFVNKSALPIWNTGLSVNAEYRNFMISAYMYGQFGHYIYNNTRNAFFTAGSINNGRNVTRDVLSSGEAGAAEAAVSTRFLEKGDFVRMQNVSLGYRVPLGTGSLFKTLIINVTGQNLFVISNYSGLDPEISSSPADFQLYNNLPTAGIDYAAYPRPRVFTIGFVTTF